MTFRKSVIIIDIPFKPNLDTVDRNAVWRRISWALQRAGCYGVTIGNLAMDNIEVYDGRKIERTWAFITLANTNDGNIAFSSPCFLLIMVIASKRVQMIDHDYCRIPHGCRASPL
jgi:hypothetical protein